MTNHPGTEWTHRSPAETNTNREKLEIARQWIDDHSEDGRYRVVIVRDGYVIAEWNRGVDGNALLPMSSAAKSVFSCILGIAIDEGRISSIDDRIVDYYPEGMDVPEGEGPKPGRYAFEKDREITFRQLISNTSGYMKPGEDPGKVFHYQTFGMNIVSHAVARIYDLYDVINPTGKPGFSKLIDDRLQAPIGATWRYEVKNFALPEKARIHVFGNYTDILATTLDMARLGWLWCNWGRWAHEQVVPADWLREATRTAPDIQANCPPEQWKYGYGFWTNDHQRLLPNLPSNSFAASGAYGTALIWVCPGLDLVVAQNPGLFLDKEDPGLNTIPGLLELIVDACD